ncbi:ABC transporter substrate-binding protein [Corynebacterium massiliense]|uniref:Corrinoid ABC transporter substrate-binding protein n=1 Tax=Corynebacterium massiliense DSM 45435 TaxID=1121364 RepID=A0ABY7U4I4_9CORY|nr:ABC transporter substrate-binding protein [Corynebacterium massiliense]WCZ31598.1 corrinoid ABC transporter substrate-binding protein [Corynebacterium massiliense DSM 45435]
MQLSTLRKSAGAVALSALTALGLTACAGDPAAESNSAGDTSAAAGDEAMTVTDVVGREVTFDHQPERILLAEGRAMFTTSLLDKDNPADKVVALGSDLHDAAPTFEEKIEEVDPEIKDLPTVGNIGKGDTTVENLLANKPDVIVMTLDHKKAAEESGFLDKMDQSGLKYVFTDYRQKPLDNTPKSVTLMGELLGKEDKAKEFTDFYEKKVDDIEKRAAKLEDKPSTFVWRAAGLKDCCGTVKDSNLGDLVNAAGGDNLGDHLLTGDSGDVTAEKILAEQPEHFIATGGAWAKNPEKPEVLPHVEMGYTADSEMADETLRGLLRTPGFEELKAAKEGNLHGVYHQFYDSPYNVFALEAFAKWLHPEEFDDLDPEKDFADFHHNWLPFEYSGTFFNTVSAK